MAKTAIITGAAKNIGKGIAYELIEKGYECILLDIDARALNETTQALSKTGTCSQYVIDMAIIEEIDNFLSWLVENKIDIDVLINNVGYESEAKVLSLNAEEITKSNDTNVTGPFYLTSKLANSMNNGAVVFISSTHSTVTRMHPLYSSSKAAVEMFIKEAALELADKNIRVNAVAPGPVVDSADLQASKYVPLRYTLQPKDIAAAVSFLVSDNARFITGQTLTVDGGFSITHTHYWKNQDKL